MYVLLRFHGNWFLWGAFQPDSAKKTTENDQSSNACQSFRITVKLWTFQYRLSV